MKKEKTTFNDLLGTLFIVCLLILLATVYVHIWTGDNTINQKLTLSSLLTIVAIFVYVWIQTALKKGEKEESKKSSFREQLEEKMNDKS